MLVGINASRARSGGARAHLIGICSEADPRRHGFREIHIWSYPSLLDALPSKPWLVKHSPIALRKSLFSQVMWERFSLRNELRRTGCTILFNVDAGTVCRFQPAVTMSQDMLSYEPGVIELFGFGKARLRLILLRHLQNRSLREADGAIFLTRYAARVIQEACGSLSHVAYIPHGVGAEFTHAKKVDSWPGQGERPIRAIYVSNAAMYKHQWVVTRAIAALRKRGYDLSLKLVGGGKGRAQRILQAEIAVSDPDRLFVQQLDFVPQKELPALLENADLFVFASSCENMPNTLLESMAVGLPIACSNRGPMPEVLADGGVYFDPEDADSIADAIEKIIQSPTLRSTISQRAKTLSTQYSWKRCADETWAFVVETHMRTKT